MIQNPYDPSGGAADDGYEFDGVENVTVAKLGKAVKIWGFVAFVAAALCVLGAIFAMMMTAALVAVLSKLGVAVAAGTFASLMVFVLLGMGLVYAVTGWFYIRAGNSLRSIVDTSGVDVPHLLQSLKSLSRAFQIEVVVTLVGLVLAIVGAAKSVGGAT